MHCKEDFQRPKAAKVDLGAEAVGPENTHTGNGRVEFENCNEIFKETGGHINFMLDFVWGLERDAHLAWQAILMVVFSFACGNKNKDHHSNPPVFA